MSVVSITSPVPTLEEMLRRLADTPQAFLAAPSQSRRGEPVADGSGLVSTVALINDWLATRGGRMDEGELGAFLYADSKDANRLQLVQIMVWLLSAEWTASVSRARLISCVNDLAKVLSTTTNALRFATEPDRREELVRSVLWQVQRLPAGETTQQAEDRLASVSGAERLKILKASRAAERRAREVREALARKAAEESADKWTRE